VRVLVVTNFEPDDSAPQRGRWVRDQVDEVRKRGIGVNLFSFSPGNVSRVRDRFKSAIRPDLRISSG
jgi:hypothetical protein